MSVETRRVKTSAGIDITEWDCGDGIPADILEDISLTIKDQFKREPPRVSLPIVWSPDDDGWQGRAVKDPAILYVEVPLSKYGSDDPCLYEISLEKLIDHVIELSVSMHTNTVVEEDTQVRCLSLATRLRELARKLEEACHSDTGVYNLKRTADQRGGNAVEHTRHMAKSPSWLGSALKGKPSVAVVYRLIVKPVSEKDKNP